MRLKQLEYTVCKGWQCCSQGNWVEQHFRPEENPVHLNLLIHISIISKIGAIFERKKMYFIQLKCLMEDLGCFYSSSQELLKAISPQEFKAQSGGSSTQPHLQCGGDRAELLHYCPNFFKYYYSCILHGCKVFTQPAYVFMTDF